MIIHDYKLFYKIRVTFILLCFGQINLNSKRIFSQELEIYSIQIFKRHFRFYLSSALELSIFQTRSTNPESSIKGNLSRCNDLQLINCFRSIYSSPRDPRAAGSKGLVDSG